MTTTDKPDTRDRLLAAAADLSYRQGVGIGVEALCKAAGVSKRSMYQLFASKDELLAASLQSRAAAYTAHLLPPADTEDTPRDRILHIFTQVQTHASAPDYKGCPFLAVQVELKSADHPASKVAHTVKENLRKYFRAEAQKGGAPDPDLLSRQLILIFDGASARAGIGADDLTGLLHPLVETLLEKAGL
ncbi:TetR/AcrR family transcriptional regulator [Streptomyces roseirectus]|uniref:TetR/AcrR family transcriptional regulator n=1 Tax=Streptomyces roseirectus TaxID=2768066 RepID=A0A7H0I9E5_9ACTN|nr:TetR/AcrR family transcriptional regulator [Streptomyces roseirectus]QNP69411.1 TetR/AcrR family transcriptional regulator [Streptomyces roseirectus]